MKIVSYRKKYQEQIFDLILTIKTNEEKMRYIKRHDLWIIKKAFLCFYVALDDMNKVIGCCGLKEIDKESVLLARFYVQKQNRHAGIGTVLYNKVFAFAKKHKYVDIFVGVDETCPSGISFYKKHGFVEIKDGKFISEDDDFTFYRVI